MTILNVLWGLGWSMVGLAEPERRRRLLWRTGLAAIAGFVLLRFANLYGDPSPWAAQERAGFTFLSFLKSAHWLFESPGLDQFPFTQPPGWPLGLGWVYLLWGVVVLTVYPLCVWYAGVKARHRDWWLSYL